MSLEYIRRAYGVPANRLRRVVFDGQPGTITGARGAHIRVRLDGQRLPVSCHPTWRMDYEPQEGEG